MSALDHSTERHDPEKNLPTIGVVGYTNAGKSALTNALTKK